MCKKIILVTGATGHQGGSVVQALLADGGYTIRALTRHTNSAAAKTLAEKGIEVVPGQLGDRESLFQACKGVYAVFGVSVPPMTPGGIDELTQGKNLVDACKANNVPLLAWSSLPSCKDTSNGRYECFVFDAKAEVDKYIKQVGQTAVIFSTAAFTENFTWMNFLKRDEHDPSKYHITSSFGAPSVRMPYTYISKDLGPAVVAAISTWEDPAWRAELTRAVIPMVSYAATGEELARVISTMTAKEVDYACVPADKLPPPLQALSAWTDEGLWGYAEPFPPAILLKLGVKLHALEDYVGEEIIPWMAAQM